MLKAKYFLFNPLQARCTLLWEEGGECLVFDPCCFTEEEEKELLDFISERGLRPVAVLLTHGHPDHICGVAALTRRFPGIPVRLNSGDDWYVKFAADPGKMTLFPPVDCGFSTQNVSDGDTFRIGEYVIEALATPGHSRGGVCYICRQEKILISGDTLFAGTIGRTDLPGGDYDLLMAGIQAKLLCLDGDVDVLPGHGPCTTIADERQKNPFLLPFNEPEPEEGE